MSEQPSRNELMEQLSYLAGYHQSKAREAEYEAKRQRELMKTAETFMKLLMDDACPACRGYGYIRVQEGHDVRSEKCKTCSGLGTMPQEKLDAALEEVFGDKGA